MKTPKYFQSNSGLGYEELNYFLQLNDKQFICVGHLLHENEPCIELGEIVTATTEWEDLSKPSHVMKEQFMPCENPNIQLDKSILKLIVNQSEEIQDLKRKNSLMESEIHLMQSRINLSN